MAKLIIILLIALVFEAVGVVWLSLWLKQIGPVQSVSGAEIARVVGRGITNRDFLLGVLFETIFFVLLLTLLKNWDVSLVWPLTRLTSQFLSKVRSRTKKMVSNRTPSRKSRLVIPRPTTRAISAPLTDWTGPICFSQRLSQTTPTASKTSAIKRIIMSLAMLQILVANQFDVQRLDQPFHARTDEGLEFTGILVERRMRVKLGITRRQDRQQPREVAFVHACILQQPKHRLGVLDILLSQAAPGAARKQAIDGRVAGAIQPASARQSRIKPEWLASQPRPPDAPAVGIQHEDPENDRVQVEMEMSVHVIERKRGRGKLLELGRHLCFQLRRQSPMRVIAEPRCHGAVAELVFTVDQAGNFFRGQCRTAANERQMEAHAQPRGFPRQGDGFIAGRLIHHQAGGGENAFAMGANDRGIDAA